MELSRAPTYNWLFWAHCIDPELEGRLGRWRVNRQFLRFRALFGSGETWKSVNPWRLQGSGDKKKRVTACKNHLGWYFFSVGWAETSPNKKKTTVVQLTLDIQCHHHLLRFWFVFGPPKTIHKSSTLWGFGIRMTIGVMVNWWFGLPEACNNPFHVRGSHRNLINGDPRSTNHPTTPTHQLIISWVVSCKKLFGKLFGVTPKKLTKNISSTSLVRSCVVSTHTLLVIATFISKTWILWHRHRPKPFPGSWILTDLTAPENVPGPLKQRQLSNY